VELDFHDVERKNFYLFNAYIACAYSLTLRDFYFHLGVPNKRKIRPIYLLHTLQLQLHSLHTDHPDCCIEHLFAQSALNNVISYLHH